MDAPIVDGPEGMRDDLWDLHVKDDEIMVILKARSRLGLHSLPTGTQSGSCDPVLKRVCG